MIKVAYNAYESLILMIDIDNELYSKTTEREGMKMHFKLIKSMEENDDYSICSKSELFIDINDMNTNI